ncbi:MAG: hypothetical protein CL524_04860 [Aequorivita sp.]|nr:hypothetical protein [Aequorivita sp.]
MGTPARKDILDNIETVLNTITTGNGYKTTVTTVEPVAKGWGDMGAGLKPFIGFSPGSERFDYQPCGSIRVVLGIALTCHISGSTQGARSSALNDLLDDIIKALSLDTSRGGKAISTTISQVETDEGSPDSSYEGSMLIRVDVAYIRTTSGS